MELPEGLDIILFLMRFTGTRGLNYPKLPRLYAGMARFRPYRYIMPEM
jgi:hypothetical protein